MYEPENGLHSLLSVTLRELALPVLENSQPGDDNEGKLAG